MKKLLEHGANPNAQNAWGYTPLMMLVRSSLHLQTAALLIEKGADLNLRDQKGRTALDHLISLKNEKKKKSQRKFAQFLRYKNAQFFVENFLPADWEFKSEEWHPTNATSAPPQDINRTQQAFDMNQPPPQLIVIG